MIDYLGKRSNNLLPFAHNYSGNDFYPLLYKSIFALYCIRAYYMVFSSKRSEHSAIILFSCII